MFRSVILQQIRNQLVRLNNVRYFTQEVNETSNVEKCLNHVTLLGRVGGDPQKRGSEDHPVVLFTLATHTNHKYSSGEFIQKTDWHKICVFKPKLRDCVYNYLKKGQRILVNGRISYNEFKDAEERNILTTTIIADNIIFFQ